MVYQKKTGISKRAATAKSTAQKTTTANSSTAKRATAKPTTSKSTSGKSANTRGAKNSNTKIASATTVDVEDDEIDTIDDENVDINDDESDNEVFTNSKTTRKRRRQTLIDSDDNSDDEQPLNRTKRKKKDDKKFECVTIRFNVPDENHPNHKLNNRVSKVAIGEIIGFGDTISRKQITKKGQEIQIVKDTVITDAKIENSFIYKVDLKDFKRSMNEINNNLNQFIPPQINELAIDPGQIRIKQLESRIEELTNKLGASSQNTITNATKNMNVNQSSSQPKKEEDRACLLQ